MNQLSEDCSGANSWNVVCIKLALTIDNVQYNCAILNQPLSHNLKIMFCNICRIQTTCALWYTSYVKVLTLVRFLAATLAAKTANKKQSISNYTLQLNHSKVLNYTTETETCDHFVNALLSHDNLLSHLWYQINFTKFIQTLATAAPSK
jgi:hypothetical protein